MTKGKVYFWSMWKSADGSLHSTSCFHGMIKLIGEQETENGKQEAGDRKQEADHLDNVQTQYFACHTKQGNNICKAS